MKTLIKTIFLSSIIAISWQPDITESYINMDLPDNKYGYMVKTNIVATKYGVSSADMKRTIKCESSWKPKALNYNPPVEISSGLSQINTLAHKHITVEQAQDVDFALEFMGENFSKNNAKIWTCYKKTNV